MMPVLVGLRTRVPAAASRILRSLTTTLLIGCGHSEFFVTSIPTLGPPGSGPDVQLTFNVDQDYWPTWSQDGRGILYAFVPLDTRITHRCIGLLPAAGGTRIWQLCDERFVRNDSTGSYTGFALSSDGRLLYAEASAPASAPQNIPNTGLWLADTAAPFRRTRLLNLPLVADGIPISWLTDIAWTGRNSFIALAQTFNTSLLCPPPPNPSPCQGNLSLFTLRDTLFALSGAVVLGTIAGDHASLRMVPGTDGATGYSISTDSSAIVFIRRDDVRLFSAPLNGGAVSTVAQIMPTDSAELLGVACKGSSCLVAAASVRLTFGGDLDPQLGRPQTWAHVIGFPLRNDVTPSGTLRSVSLATGVVTTVKSLSTVIADPKFSPVSNDLVISVGGIWGHLQTFERGDPNSALHLLSGLVP
jgi:hypothetical protein